MQSEVKSDAQRLDELRAVLAQFEKNAAPIIALAHLALKKARRER